MAKLNLLNNKTQIDKTELAVLMKRASQDLPEIVDDVVFSGLSDGGNNNTLSLFAENLSNLYQEKSFTVDQEIEKAELQEQARKWFEISAAAGNLRAIVFIADELAVAGDKKQALYFYKLAYVKAHTNLTGEDTQTFEFLCLVIRHCSKVNRQIAFEMIGPLLDKVAENPAMKKMLRVIRREMEPDDLYTVQEEYEAPGVVVFKAVEDSADKDVTETLKPFKEKMNKKIPLVTFDNLPLLRETLDMEFPAFSKLTDQVIKSLTASLHGDGVFRMPPMLLSGAPGIGKTFYCNRLCELIDVPSLVIGLAGSTDNQDLKGLSRSYGTGRPSRVVSQLARQNVANPLFVLDELDKVSAESRNGSVTDTLLLMLEKQNSKKYFDEFLCGPVDLSHVNWIATANSTAQLPKPLLSRFKVIELEAPKGFENYVPIVKRTIKDFADEHKIDHRFIPEFGDKEWDMLEKFFKNPRTVRKVTESLLREMLFNPKINLVH